MIYIYSLAYYSRSATNHVPQATLSIYDASTHLCLQTTEQLFSRITNTHGNTGWTSRRFLLSTTKATPHRTSLSNAKVAEYFPRAISTRETVRAYLQVDFSSNRCQFSLSGKIRLRATKHTHNSRLSKSSKVPQLEVPVRRYSMPPSKKAK